MDRIQILRRRIRWLTGFFMLGLFLSGFTAIPLTGEVNGLAHWLGPASGGHDLAQWLGRVREALVQTQAAYPFTPLVAPKLQRSRMHAAAANRRAQVTEQKTGTDWLAAVRRKKVKETRRTRIFTK